MAEKSPDAFRTITEVSEWLDTPTYVLRFWESRFPQIKPVKRAGGRRYYRPEDMQLLGGIKKLLHFDEYTIKAVKEVLKDKGVKHVMSLSPDLDAPVQTPQRKEVENTTSEIDELVAKAEQDEIRLAKPKVGVRIVRREAEDQVVEAEPEDSNVSAERPTGSVIESQGEPSTDDADEETQVSKSDDKTDGSERQLEDWQMMDPRMIENAPYRVSSSRMYTQKQLAEIEAIYADLSSIRDRMQSAA